MTIETGWQESDSELFGRYGDAITPSREEHLRMLTALVPAEPDDSFLAVDLAAGGGSLSEALLRAYPNSRVLALDGSPEMLRTAENRLHAYRDRLELRQFDLRESDWLDALPDMPRLFASSLAVHHLAGREKRQLFRRLADRLAPGGGLLILDIVFPVHDRAWSAYTDAWDLIVETQSREIFGDDEAYRFFQESEWNHYRTPDLEFDKPSKLFDQLLWLRDAGLEHIDCFWLRAGHALYGGYRPTGV